MSNEYPVGPGTTSNTDATIYALVALNGTAHTVIEDLGLDEKATEYVLVARPAATESRLQALQAELDDARAQVEAERAELLALQHQLRETQALLNGERERILAETAEGARELSVVKKERDDALRRLKKATSQNPSGGRNPGVSGNLRRVVRRMDRVTNGQTSRVLRKGRAIVRRGRGSKAGA